MHVIGSNICPRLNRSCHTIVRNQGLIVGTWESLIPASCESVFALLERIGGRNGWYFANQLWRLRGWLDRAVGGPGLVPRRDPFHLIAGDTFDFWMVETIEPGVRITLRSKMRMPGRAWLDFQCAPDHGSSTMLRTVILYQPSGLLGELYWLALYPFHVAIFNGMHQAIARKSQLADAQISTRM